MRDTQRLDERDAKIKKRMAQLEKKYPKWRAECYIEQLAKEFFLADRTIENILKGTSRSKPKRMIVDEKQMVLFP